MAKKKIEELTLEDRTYIQNYAVTPDGQPFRTMEQMAMVITKPVELVERFAKELYPQLDKKEEKETGEYTKTMLHEMTTPRPGMAIMTEAASQVSDDIKKKVSQNRMTHNAIFRPLKKK